MADSAESCAHCGEHGAGFKRCSRCKQASYCGAECQNASWKRHKKTCAPPVPLQDLAAKIDAAQAAGDWRGVLNWEGRLEELMALRSDDNCSGILKCFAYAHHMGFQATGSKDHARSFLRWTGGSAPSRRFSALAPTPSGAERGITWTDHSSGNGTG